jgi:hypothetical protein
MGPKSILDEHQASFVKSIPVKSNVVKSDVAV